MRVAFLDEGGVSNARDEPYGVVAGVVVHGDEDFAPLEAELADLIRTFPANHEEERFIHTYKIYGGTGPFHKSRGWSEAKRFDLLHAVADLLIDQIVPVVWGYCDKSEYAAVEDHWKQYFIDQNRFAHLMAAADCTIQVEQTMREYAEGEICSLVMENTPHNRQLLKQQHRVLARMQIDPTHRAAAWLPLTRIRGTPQFEDKDDASLLQLADFCCFVIKRRLMGDPRIDPLYLKVRDAISYLHKDADHPIGPYDKPLKPHPEKKKWTRA